jgi:hypothetical protein
MVDFQDELVERGFSSEGIVYHIRLVLSGLNRLEAFMHVECPTQDIQDQFDLMYDGIVKNVNQIRNFAAEVDKRLCTPISR